MRLPDTLAEVAERLDAVAPRDAVRLTPYTDDEVLAIETLALPDLLTDEVAELLRLDCVSPWARPRLDLNTLVIDAGVLSDSLFAPHWLPIGWYEREVWSVVLGPEPLVRSPVVVWSSNALVSAAPFPSLRTFLLGYAEAARVMADLDGDDLVMMRSDWWQAACDDRRFTDDLEPHWQRLEGPFRELIEAEDESPLWPGDLPPMPFTDHVGVASWDPRWREALRVDEWSG